MRAICILNESAKLADHQRNAAAAIESPYPLTRGEEYVIVGMLISEHTLYVLTEEDGGRPTLAPAGFFKEFDAEIPSHWCFALQSGIHASGRQLWASPLVATWGFPEMVNNPEYLSDLLLEGKIEALEAFRAEIAAGESRGCEGAEL